MVEQSTAASHSLAQEAEALQASVSRFRTGHVEAPAAHHAPARHAPAHRPAANHAPHQAPAPRHSSRVVDALKTLGRGGAALKPHAAPAEDGWEEF